MKKIYAWVSDEVYEKFKKCCEEKGVSMYAVLKESIEALVEEPYLGCVPNIVPKYIFYRLGRKRSDAEAPSKQTD